MRKKKYDDKNIGGRKRIAIYRVAQNSKPLGLPNYQTIVLNY